MKKILILFAIICFFSCKNEEKIKVDAIVINANVYTVNASFDKAQAFAIKDGKFFDIGRNSDIQDKYESHNIIDAKEQTVLPGLIDAHCHFLGLGFNQQSINLFGTKSFEEVVDSVVAFHKRTKAKFITGRGWDQNDWLEKEFPTKDLLDAKFPNTPVVLTRIDGHAVICNQAALNLGKVTKDSKVEGGEVVLKDGKPTGVLIDNAETLVMDAWPKNTRKDIAKALIAAQDICFKYGLTTVDDAGLNRDAIEVIDSLQKADILKMRVYAMVSTSDENLDYYLNKGIYKTDYLNVRSFKVYGDGALGSRGALLRKPYSDHPNHFGLPITSIPKLDSIAQRIANSKFQMNTHAIGDSANHTLLTIYNKVLKDKSDRRWRIEHAQVISPKDFEKFKNVIPSVQPTHATSDMYWAEERLGKERLKNAYAYQDLLKVYGKIALGTDFPVEEVSPFLTFHSAVARQDLEDYPLEGFQMENALSREETLQGMTIWAAYSNFEENEKGSIEVGKFADFIILDKNIMVIDNKDIPKVNVLKTFVNGVLQYEMPTKATENTSEEKK
ncbi:amidohydrolase [Subsaxibacter sp. CAU 1640]|uniref:amidohydrolase n=1 Tax=Subsaxibacter sp. CAU 1640 TaxID=2933271 RepID=UPI0020054A0F|nr:amidohydrolase [Subsaxibacter sp. CAU 1640]MCK7590070.1 amidohydrolase [Subsaxibacter sp. CAU 1640]